MGQENRTENAGHVPMEKIEQIEAMSGTELRFRFASEYNSWKNAKTRAKGEKVEFGEEFVLFRSFLKAMGPKPGADFTLDRVQAGGPYTAKNCRWADKKTQSENRRNVRMEEFNGERMTLPDLSRRTGISPSALYSARGKRGTEAIITILGFDPKSPWPQGQAELWDRHFRKQGASGERPVEFYYRFAQERYRAVGMKYLDPEDPQMTAEQLPEPRRSEYIELEAKWRRSVEDAQEKRRKYVELMREIENGRKAESARRTAVADLDSRYVQQRDDMLDDLGL